MQDFSAQDGLLLSNAYLRELSTYLLKHRSDSML